MTRERWRTQGCTILPLCSYWQSEPQPLRTRRPTSSSILQNGFPRFSIATASPVASSRLSTPSIRGTPSARWHMNSESVDRRHQPMLSVATASLGSPTSAMHSMPCVGSTCPPPNAVGQSRYGSCSDAPPSRPVRRARGLVPRSGWAACCSRLVAHSR